MTLPETVEQQNCHEHNAQVDDERDDDEFGPARTILRRTKSKISMISSELRLREKRKRVLQLCLRKLERMKDSENNLRRSVIIHNTFSRLSNDIKRDKEKGHPRQQQQNYNFQQKNTEKLDFDNLEELCSIDDNGLPIYDPILKNSEEIEQALSRKRKAEVEKALLSYHQLEKRLKSDIATGGFHDVQDVHYDISNQTCNNLLNSFQTSMCSKAVALDSSSLLGYQIARNIM